MICNNCSKEFEGNFCNSCGQSAKQRRIDSRYFFTDIPNSVFQLDSGFFLTAKELFVRPGATILEYLKGKRKKHYRPLAYLVLLSAGYVILSRIIGKETFIDDFIVGFKSMAPSKRFGYGFLDWLGKNQSYAQLMVLPFYSLASYLAFIKSKYNYFEHLVLNMYITGQQMLIYIIFNLIPSDSILLNILPYLFGIGFNFWAYFNFFKEKSAARKIVLMTLTYFLFFLQLLGGILLLGFFLATSKT